MPRRRERQEALEAEARVAAEKEARLADERKRAEEKIWKKEERRREKEEVRILGIKRPLLVHPDVFPDVVGCSPGR